MSFILEKIQEKERLILVGPNSQGKTHALEEFSKNRDVKNNCIAVWSEVKADEGLKNSADSTMLITWLNELLDTENISNAIDDKINEIDFTELNSENSINVNLENNFSSLKGLIGANITTNSNTFTTPGSGEKFLGTLYLIAKILEECTDDRYKYLIMDEPERHLHPTLYVKVASVLNKISKMGIKVVISTHSKEILKYFIEDTDEIIKMDNGQPLQLSSKGTYIELVNNFNLYNEENFKFDSYRMIENNLKLYFENFILPLIYKSLFSKTIILGEGIAEETLLELFKNKYSHINKMDNVDSIIVYGKCFYPWMISCLQLIGIKVISIYDVDNKNPKHNNLNSLINDNSTKFIPIDPKVEVYLNLTKIKDKAKKLVLEIRNLYLSNDESLMSLLLDIKEKVDEI